jgi:hypothetical protein
MKGTLALYGNCQVLPIVQALACQPAVAAEWECHSILSFPDPCTGRLAIPKPLLERCSVLLEQLGEWNRDSSIEQLVPESCHILRFPTLSGGFLWPLRAGKDPRDSIIPGRFPFGILTQHVTDRIALEMLECKAQNNDLLEAYYSIRISDRIDLDRLLEMECAHYRLQEKRCHIQMLNYVLENYREHRLFWVDLHPSSRLYCMLATRIIEELSHCGISPFSKSQEAIFNGVRAFFEQNDPSNDLQAPIHPEVLKHFGLKWVNGNTKYAIRDIGEFTHREFIAYYLQFDAGRFQSPNENSPQEVEPMHFRIEKAVNRIRHVCRRHTHKRIILYGNGSHTRQLLRSAGENPFRPDLIIDRSLALPQKSSYGAAVVPLENYEAKSGDLIILSSQVFEKEMWEDLSVMRKNGIQVMGLYDSTLVTTEIRKALA